ncbi:twin-arginine translocase subunit TatC [Amphibiibacter pelophylacis]|uniref:Twin-arginine translocase subunit TatC n=1 Tax=Amphibiibacter pelophylacis TaxID=1799477 RepID=A0ACC6P193_9BURK
MSTNPSPPLLPGPDTDPGQPFITHLIELRDRLIRAIIAILVVFAALCVWPSPSGMYDLLAAPLVSHFPVGTHLIATSVISPIVVPIKITLLAAFFVALPYVLFQMWSFIAPGLYNHEKKAVMPLVVASTLLFFAGVAFCFFLVIPSMSKFIQSWAPASITAAPDIEQYFSFVLTLFVVFGCAFEVPIVVIGLAQLGLVSVQQLKSFRGYFIVVAFVVSALVTPPDVLSQLALAIPMIMLYQIGIWFVQMTQRQKKEAEAQAEEASESRDLTAPGEQP